MTLTKELVATMGFVSRGSYNLSHEDNGDWMLNPPWEHNPDWMLEHRDYGGSHPINTVGQLLEAVFQFGLIAGEKNVKDNLRNLFGIKE